MKKICKTLIVYCLLYILTGNMINQRVCVAVENDCLDVFQTLSTRVGLKMNYTIDETKTTDIYGVTSVVMRVGGFITKDMYQQLLKANNNFAPVLGVALITGDAIGNQEFSENIVGITYRDCSKKITVVKSDKAMEESETGDYYLFGVSITNIKAYDYDADIVATCYAQIDNTIYFMKSARYSINDLAKAYCNMEDTSSYEYHLEALKYLSNYVE